MTKGIETFPETIGSIGKALAKWGVGDISILVEDDVFIRLAKELVSKASWEEVPNWTLITLHAPNGIIEIRRKSRT